MLKSTANLGSSIVAIMVGVAALILTATPQSQTFPVGVQGLVTQFEIIWNDMAASGVIAMALPLILMVIGRRYIVAGLTFGVIREK